MSHPVPTHDRDNEYPEDMDLMEQYDKDKAINRKRWFRGVLSTSPMFGKRIPVKYALNEYDRTYTLKCPFWGHLGAHYGTCEAFDTRIEQEIDEMRGK